MKPKEKKCKGTGKAKGFGCGELSLYRTYGLCHSKCYPKWLYNTDEGREKIERATLKVTKDRKKQEVKKTREQKEKLKTISNLIAEAKKPFQKYIRLRDQEKPCISCGTDYSDIWDGGHFYKAENYSGLIFDERNCRKQCRKCNNFLGGNENNYRLGLIKLEGIEYVKKLDEDAIRLKKYKYSRDEILSIKKHYQEKVNQFKNNV